GFRLASAADVRHHRDRVPGRHHADRELHDGGRGQQSGVYASRHHGGFPPALPSQQQSAEDGFAGPTRALSRRGLRGVRREARRHAGRRRHCARPLDAGLRQQHERRCTSRSFPADAGDRRRRLRNAARQSAYSLRRAHADREPVAYVAESGRRKRRHVRRQHRGDRGSMRLAAAAAVVACALAVSAPTTVRASDLLHAAAANDRSAAVALLDAGADPTATEPNGTTVLHWAVYHDDEELVGRLLAAGADPAAVNAYGSSPMLEAAVKGNSRVMKALLDAGANVESPNDDGQTALMVVARSSNLDAARLLLERGANPNAVERWRGQTALMWAAAQRQAAMIRLLLEHGADPDVRSLLNRWERQVSAEPRAQWRPPGGWTALMYAARHGCVDCAVALVEVGADPDIANEEGVTPLIVAITNLHFDVARALLEHGANPNKWDWRGRTPL